MDELLTGSLALRIAVFLAGFLLVIWTLLSAIRTFVLPRAHNETVSRWVFRGTLAVLWLRLRHLRSYEERDRLLAYFAPIALLLMPLIWLTLILFGYAAMYWSTSATLSVSDALVVSGSSLMTLGFSFVDEGPAIVLSFSEAVLSMLLIALLVGYLPTMYSAFAQREALVASLETIADSPPTSERMVQNLWTFGVLADEASFNALWKEWEEWFYLVENNHTSLAALNFFRSPRPERSWVTAAGTVMDAAAIVASSVDLPHAPKAARAIRAGYVCLRSIADFFEVDYDANPRPSDPIHVTREEFDQAYEELRLVGVPLKPDRDACWRHFAGWRVNYDLVLLLLARITYAPYAPWISDRSPYFPASQRRRARKAKRFATWMGR